MSCMYVIDLLDIHVCATWFKAYSINLLEVVTCLVHADLLHFILLKYVFFIIIDNCFIFC